MEGKMSIWHLAYMGLGTLLGLVVFVWIWWWLEEGRYK